jgi:signal transduction histidine kinase/ActR/RegA family two-component response regulator
MGQRASHAAARRSPPFAYLVAVLITALAAAVRFSLFGVLGTVEPYMPFVMAIMVVASYGGLKPGLLATALSAVAGVYFFVAPVFSLWIETVSEGVAAVLFVIAGVTISWMCEALHSARRRLEVKRGQLEQEVKERQRAEAAAREGEARLKEADRHKDEFLAMLAHELRNPLAPIRNAVEVLRLRGPRGPDLLWGRDVIERQVDCLTRLIDDLLDMSRISRGKIGLRKRRVGLAEIITGAIESSRPLIDRHGHELSVVLPPEPVPLEADAVRLAQVFMNLLNNAAKYTGQGGHIRLTAERRGGDVVVSVKDDGIGIPPDELPRLFEMFFQVERSSERSEGGLGIGLSLVQRLVEMHGGTVEARSEGPGKGSEFLVRLPVTLDKPAPPPEPGDSCGTKGTTARRVLVVDDSRDSTESLAMLLRLYGHEVRTAHDGVECVEAAERYRPDVVLLDIGMPRLNGLDACRRLREQTWGKDMALIALTGLGQEEDRRRTKEAGFDHHLVKPVDPADLAKLLASTRPGRAAVM